MSSYSKSDSKAVSNEDILARVSQLEETVKVLFSELGFKLEKTLISKHSPKPSTNSSNSKQKAVKKASGNVPANSMYWWREMYASEDPIIKNLYTEDDVKNAVKTCTKIKEKASDYDKRKAYGYAIYSTFTKAKKQEIKGMFDTWKKEHAKNNTTSVKKENDSDDEKKEIKTEE